MILFSHDSSPLTDIIISELLSPANVHYSYMYSAQGYDLEVHLSMCDVAVDDPREPTFLQYYWPCTPGIIM